MLISDEVVPVAPRRSAHEAHGHHRAAGGIGTAVVHRFLDDGPFLMTPALLELLTCSSAGRVINTSSGSIFKGLAKQAHYVASKAGVIGLTRSLANVLGRALDHVQRNHPGGYRDPPVVALYPPDQLAAKARERSLKRQEEAGDLVGAVAFLASDDAAFITGQILNVDGGTTFY